MDRRQTKIERLMRKGVAIPTPHGVEIGDEVDLKRISAEGVVFHAGTKIFGPRTLILRGARIGREGPVTVENCQVGPDVDLKGGFFKDAVFLEGSSMGSGAHVRGATIVEEQASAAHTVALKQTILFPFATLGSLVNFCDCLLAGGTSRRNHSEVGSAYIHFNYTPRQDKATASLLGDVPNGVMLNQRPIFLGGQGGLVGPCRLAYGTVIAAGTVWRRDELKPERLLFGGARKTGSIPYRPGAFGSDRKIVKNNLVYIANLSALMQWYSQVRCLLVGSNFPKALHEAMQAALSGAISERIVRLGDLCRGVPEDRLPVRTDGREAPRPNHFQRHWPELEAVLKEAPRTEGETGVRDAFLARVEGAIGRVGKDYLAVVKSFSAETAAAGTLWLQGIVDRVVQCALAKLPGL